MSEYQPNERKNWEIDLMKPSKIVSYLTGQYRSVDRDSSPFLSATMARTDFRTPGVPPGAGDCFLQKLCASLIGENISTIPTGNS